MQQRASPDHIMAEQAWMAMRHHKVTPLPRNFAVWFAHASGNPIAVRSTIDTMVASGHAFTQAALDGLHAELLEFGVASIANANANADGVQAIQEIAATLVAQIVSNQAGVTAYGESLAHWTARLRCNPTLTDVQRAIAELVVETQQAHARNAMLEQQIASSIICVDEMQSRMDEAEQRAATDTLTGLNNRAVFDRTLQDALAQARGGGSTLSVIMLDIDHFKQFNDRFGHSVGDLVLRLVARVLASNVKGRDTVARYGGEEFAIVLTGAGLDAAATVGEQIRQALSKMRLTHKSMAQPLGSITVSIGISVYRKGDTGAALLERADKALYRAKHTGRNLVCTEAMVSAAELVAG